MKQCGRIFGQQTDKETVEDHSETQLPLKKECNLLNYSAAFLIWQIIISVNSKKFTAKKFETKQIGIPSTIEYIERKTKV